MVVTMDVTSSGMAKMAASGAFTSTESSGNFTVFEYGSEYLLAILTNTNEDNILNMDVFLMSRYCLEQMTTQP